MLGYGSSDKILKIKISIRYKSIAKNKVGLFFNIFFHRFDETGIEIVCNIFAIGTRVGVYLILMQLCFACRKPFIGRR